MMHVVRGSGGAGDERADERVVEALRARVAPPDHPGYWDTLESRILARIAADTGPWWQAFGGWVRAGLVAAGVAVLVAGAAAWQTRASEARVAYGAVIDQSPATAAVAEESPRARTDREATIRYLMAH